MYIWLYNNLITWAGEKDGNATNFWVVGTLIGAATCWYVGNAKWKKKC